MPLEKEDLQGGEKKPLSRTIVVLPPGDLVGSKAPFFDLWREGQRRFKR